MSTVTGLRISTDGDVTQVELGSRDDSTLHALYREIGCDLVEVIALTTQVDMWVDEEGMYRQEVNHVATALARRYGWTHQPYFGTVVLTGGSDAEGASESLAPIALVAVRDVLMQIAN